MDAQARLAKVDLLPVVGLALAFGLGILVTSPQEGLTVGLVAALAYLIVILWNPFAGFLLLLVSFPLSKYLYLDISLGKSVPDVTLLRLCTAMFLIILLAQIATGRRKPAPLTAMDVVAVLALLGIGPSIMMAEEKTRAAQYFLDAYVAPVLVYWIAKNVVRTRPDREKVAIALIVVGVYSSLAAMHEQFTGQIIFDPGIGSAGMYSKQVRRLIGLLASPVAFGVVLGMALPFATHFLLYATRLLKRLLLSFAIMAIIGGLYATALRTSWIASFLGILIMVLFHPVMTRRQVRRVALALLALTIALGIPLGSVLARAAFESPIVADRIFSQGPVRARLVLYATTWQMVRENPIRGIGIENYYGAYTHYLTGWGDIPGKEGLGANAPHNSFMYVLVSAGVLGFVPYALLFILIIFQVARAHQRADGAIGRGLFVAFWVAMLSYLLNAMAADLVYLPWTSVYFFALLGAFLAPIAPKSEGEPGKRESEQAQGGRHESSHGDEYVP